MVFKALMVGITFTMHGTHGDEAVKDHLEKVSGRLRKAVGLNRHEIGGLRNVVSQMNRERNRSVGILSKQQQDFIQKQAKLLPSIGIDKRRGRLSSNQVIPLDINETGKKSQFSKSNQYKILPPINRWSRVTKDDFRTHENEAKKKRISDYQKEFSSLQESLNNAYKFANNQAQSENDDRQPEAACCSDEKSTDLKKQQWQKKLHRFDENEERVSDNLNTFIHEVKSLPRDDIRQVDVNTVAEIDTSITVAQRAKVHEKFPDEIDMVAVENHRYIWKNKEQKKPGSNWNIVRNRLRSIATMNKKRHSQYLDQLYEEIRKCRYIRKPKRKDDSDNEEDVFG